MFYFIFLKLFLLIKYIGQFSSRIHADARFSWSRNFQTLCCIVLDKKKIVKRKMRYTVIYRVNEKIN